MLAEKGSTIGVAPVIFSAFSPAPIRPIASKSSFVRPPGRSKTTTAGTSSLAPWPRLLAGPESACSASVDSAPLGRKLAWPAAVTSPMWERQTYPPTARATQTAIVTQRPRRPVTAAASAAITLGTLPPCPFG